MPTETWTCLGCDKPFLVIGERRARAGYLQLCLGCSVERAEKMLDIDGPREVAWDTDLLRWYIDHLKARIKSAEREANEEARYAAQMAADADYDRRHYP